MKRERKTEKENRGWRKREVPVMIFISDGSVYIAYTINLIRHKIMNTYDTHRWVYIGPTCVTHRKPSVAMATLRRNGWIIAVFFNCWGAKCHVMKHDSKWVSSLNIFCSIFSVGCDCVLLSCLITVDICQLWELLLVKMENMLNWLRDSSAEQLKKTIPYRKDNRRVCELRTEEH